MKRYRILFKHAKMPFNLIAEHTIDAQIEMVLALVSDNPADKTITFDTDADYQRWLMKHKHGR